MGIVSLCLLGSAVSKDESKKKKSGKSEEGVTVFIRSAESVHGAGHRDRLHDEGARQSFPI